MVMSVARSTAGASASNLDAMYWKASMYRIQIMSRSVGSVVARSTAGLSVSISEALY